MRRDKRGIDDDNGVFSYLVIIVDDSQVEKGL